MTHLKRSTIPDFDRLSLSKVVLGFATVMMVLFSACSQSDCPTASEKVVKKVAIVLPFGEDSSWETIVNMALSNYHEAAEIAGSNIEIQADLKDESDTDLETYLHTISQSEEYVALIGPYTSSKAVLAVESVAKNKKPVILPLATSADFQRLNAGNNYIWNLAESDITQCELLLSQVCLAGIKKVSLLACDNSYGATYLDWFSYQVRELGLETGEIIAYKDMEQLRQAVENFTDRQFKNSALLFVPRSASDMMVFDRRLSEVKTEGYPLIYCSDTAFSSELSGKISNQFHGLSPSADPSSGFVNIFRNRIGREPQAGETQVFDAITMLAYSLNRNTGENLAEDIRAIVDGRDSWGRGWMPGDMAAAMIKIRDGGNPDLNGASGDWTFDPLHHASPLNTIYCHWTLSDGKFMVLEYLSSDGSGRTTSSTQIWENEISNYQNFDPDQQDFNYGTQTDNYAVVIGASDTWADYRHQADALAMYSMLRRHGYDDSHIILIVADNLAYDPRNIYPGVVKVRPDGENVYAGAQIDYRLNDLKVSDLRDILLGNHSSRLPIVLKSGRSNNVLVFWCGHGNAGKVAWGSDSFISGYDFSRILKDMKEDGKFRKLMLTMDTCYSGSIGKACEGIQGLVVLTSARADEPSKADMKDPEMGIWLSNGFTRMFQETIDETPGITLRDLYYRLARYTTGSHATMFNLSFYGSAYTNTMEEFLPQ